MFNLITHQRRDDGHWKIDRRSKIRAAMDWLDGLKILRDPNRRRFVHRTIQTPNDSSRCFAQFQQSENYSTLAPLTWKFILDHLRHTNALNSSSADSRIPTKLPGNNRVRKTLGFSEPMASLRILPKTTPLKTFMFSEGYWWVMQGSNLRPAD